MLINFCVPARQQQTQFRMAIQFSVRGCCDGTSCDNGTKAGYTLPEYNNICAQDGIQYFFGAQNGVQTMTNTTRNTQTSEFWTIRIGTIVRCTWNAKMSPCKVVHGQHGHEAHLVEHAQDEHFPFSSWWRRMRILHSYIFIQHEWIRFLIENVHRICYLGGGARRWKNILRVVGDQRSSSSEFRSRSSHWKCYQKYKSRMISEERSTQKADELWNCCKFGIRSPIWSRRRYNYRMYLFRVSIDWSGFGCVCRRFLR